MHCTRLHDLSACRHVKNEVIAAAQYHKLKWSLPCHTLQKPKNSCCPVSQTEVIPSLSHTPKKQLLPGITNWSVSFHVTHSKKTVAARYHKLKWFLPSHTLQKTVAARYHKLNWFLACHTLQKQLLPAITNWSDSFLVEHST